MLFELLRPIVECLIEREMRNSGEDRQGLLTKIREITDKMSAQYQSSTPSLHYHDALYQIGYLYRQAAANAFMFQSSHSNKHFVRRLKSTSNSTLRMVAVGGGPGTDLLGLLVTLSKGYRPAWPKRIKFTVVDRVASWKTAISLVVKVVERSLEAASERYRQEVPNLSWSLVELDILAAKSKGLFNDIFHRADIVVLNYILSENKRAFEMLPAMAQQLKSSVPHGCIVVVIDRHEQDGMLTDAIREAFEDAFGSFVGAGFGYSTIGEQAIEMGDELLKALGMPRLVLSREGHSNAVWMIWEKSTQ